MTTSKDLTEKDLENAKPVVRLENWYISNYFYGDTREVAWGNCYGHPRLPDGLDVHTSWIQSKHLTDIQPKIVTQNTIYILGERAHGTNSEGYYNGDGSDVPSSGESA